MEKEKIHIKVVMYMKDNGKKDYDMEKEKLYIKMGQYIKEYGKMIKKMVLDFCLMMKRMKRKRKQNILCFG